MRDKKVKVKHREDPFKGPCGRPCGLTFPIEILCSSLPLNIELLHSPSLQVGILKVHLFRPFSTEHFLAELPDTATGRVFCCLFSEIQTPQGRSTEAIKA